MTPCPTCATLREMYDSLLAKHHELTMTLAQPAEVKAPEMAPVETDFPPPQVLAAMRRISPTRDRTFDANWAYWERNKEHAAKDPEAFALDILQGVEYDRPTADAAQSTE